MSLNRQSLQHVFLLLLWGMNRLFPWLFVVFGLLWFCGGWQVLVLSYGEPFITRFLAPLERIANAPSTSWDGAILAVAMQGMFLFVLFWMVPASLLVAMVIGGTHLDTALHRRWGFPVARPPRVRRPLPLTPAQQARYDTMRAQGWSELASRQAAERLLPPA